MSSLQTKETQMKLTVLDSCDKTKGSRKLWEFTQESQPGEIHCILGDKERKVIRIFYDLVKHFSQNRHTGYLIFHKPHARQNFYLLNNNITQSQPLHSFEDILHEIKRLVLHYEEPVLFIKDYFEIVIRTKYWTEKKDDAFKAAYVMLKEIAEKYRIQLYVFMLFKTGEEVKKFFLPMQKRTYGLKKERHWSINIDKIYCTYRSEYASLKGRKILERQFLAAHPEIEEFHSTVVVTSMEQMNDNILFDPAMPAIFCRTPFIFDKRWVPKQFKNYSVDSWHYSRPCKYFPADRSLKFGERYSVENLQRFVDDHLELISRTLKRPGLSRMEALDAITGGFKNHIELCEKLTEQNEQ